MSIKKALSTLALSTLIASSVSPAFALNINLIDDGNGSSYTTPVPVPAPTPDPIRLTCTYSRVPEECFLADFDNDCDVDMVDVNRAVDAFKNLPNTPNIDINYLCRDFSGNIASLGDGLEDFADVSYVVNCRNAGWRRQGCTKPPKVIDNITAQKTQRLLLRQVAPSSLSGSN